MPKSSGFGGCCSHKRFSRSFDQAPKSARSSPVGSPAGVAAAGRGGKTPRRRRNGGAGLPCRYRNRGDYPNRKQTRTSVTGFCCHTRRRTDRGGSGRLRGLVERAGESLVGAAPAETRRFRHGRYSRAAWVAGTGAAVSTVSKSDPAKPRKTDGNKPPVRRERAACSTRRTIRRRKNPVKKCRRYGRRI